MVKKFINILVLSGLVWSGFAAEPLSHVVIVGVDGMSPNGISHADTPVIDKLIKTGSHTMLARAVLPTSSSSNWASMIMGAGPEQHGITSNGWQRDDFILPPVTQGMENIFPTIFGLIRQQRPDAEIGAIYDWEGFGRLFEKSAVNYDISGKDAQKTADLAVAYIRSKKPTFTFVHLDHVDHAGHEFGHGSPQYYAAVKVADKLIGQIFEAAQQSGLLDDGLFIVTADHGGYGYGHGGETPAEIEIPFILYGRDIKKGYFIKQPVYTYDNAATVAWALGLEPPYAWIGRPVKSAFVGYPAPLAKNEKTRLSAPIIYPPQNFYDPPGGFYLDTIPAVKIESVDKNVDIYYTTDGSEPDRSAERYKKPFQLGKSAVVIAKTFREDNEESLPAKAFFRVLKSNDQNGVRYSYYEGENWVALPAFAGIKPMKTGKAHEFRLNQVEYCDGQFAILFSGYLKIEKPGQYKFYTVSDDGSRLSIDDKEVVNNDGDHGTLERSGSVQLEPGMHKITVEYFNGGGGAWLDVFYRGPGIPKQIIPPDLLYLQN